MGSMDLLSKMTLLLSEDGGVYHMGICSGIPTASYWLHWEDQKYKKWGSPFDTHKKILMR